jgi:hypothetical protein
MDLRTLAPNEIDLTARTRSARVKRLIGFVLVALIAAGCFASSIAGPEEPAVRIIAGAVSLLIMLGFALFWRLRQWMPTRLVVDHEGIRVLSRRKRPLVRLAWTELSGVGVMTNQFSLWRQQQADRLEIGPRMAAVSIWLELYPADAAAVARHPELRGAWELGRGGAAVGEQQRWLIRIGDTLGQEFPIGDAVQRWRAHMWRGHRSGSVLFGGHEAQLAFIAGRGPADMRPRRQRNAEFFRPAAPPR